MANCDPWELAENLPCLTCFNPVMEDGVALALLEEIVEGSGVETQYEATDQGQRVTTDDGKNIVLNI